MCVKMKHNTTISMAIAVSVSLALSTGSMPGVTANIL